MEGRSQRPWTAPIHVRAGQGVSQFIYMYITMHEHSWQCKIVQGSAYPL